MKNKLQKVFANNITKKIENNEKIYTSINKQKEIKQTTHILKEKSEKQINSLEIMIKLQMFCHFLVHLKVAEKTCNK